MNDSIIMADLSDIHDDDKKPRGDEGEEKERELESFDLNVISIMTHLFKHNVVEDSVMETLRELNVIYHTLLDKNNILEEKVNIDVKTSLLKYRDDYLALILKAASRIIDMIPNENYRVAYIRFDIDDFSKLNNKYGHDKGDQVLVDFAHIMKECSRPTDYIIRFGGEEFDVILPSTDLKGATTYLDKMYQKIKNLQYDFDGNMVSVTASAGLAIFSIPFLHLKRINNEKVRNQYQRLQRAADDALYDAKLSGKNQYKLYNDRVDYSLIRSEYAEKTRR